MSRTFDEIAGQLCALAREAHERGSVMATSGNFSAVVAREPRRVAITPSGTDKGALSADRILEIDGDGRVLRGAGRPSAETAVHLAVIRARGAGAVAHTHSMWATLLSEGAGAEVAIEGYEMLKALSGVTTHEHREVLPVVENTQDWDAGVREIEKALERVPGAHGFLIRGHGLYTWGADVAEAGRHLAALEFLLEVHGRRTWRS